MSLDRKFSQIVPSQPGDVCERCGQSCYERTGQTYMVRSNRFSWLCAMTEHYCSEGCYEASQ